MEPFGLYREALGVLRLLLLAVGVVVIFSGIVLASYYARGTGGRVASRVGSHAALGLEFFVAATILNLVLDNTLTAAAVIALTIVTRKLLTFSLGRVAREGGPR